MKTRYNITLSESDLLIIAWKRKIMEAKPSEMSALIKDAILTFIETGTFIDIGHIHFNPEQEIFKKGNSIVLLTARTPIINDWINENVKEGLGISQPIKILLKECIKVVPEEEEEYFPPTRKATIQNGEAILNIMRKNACKVGGQHHQNTKEKEIEISPDSTKPILHTMTTTSKDKEAPTFDSKKLDSEETNQPLLSENQELTKVSDTSTVLSQDEQDIADNLFANLWFKREK